MRLRSSQHFWWTLAIVPTKAAEKIKGGVGRIFEVLLSQIYSDTFHLGNLGVRLPYGTSQRPRLHVFLKFGKVVADERALKEVCSSKGSSGLLCCPLCSNVLSRTDEEHLAVQDYMISFKDPDFNKFDLHSYESYCAVRDELARQKPLLNKSKFTVLEKQLGLNFCEDGGVIFGALAPMCRVPECIVFDTLHCIWASGGVSQYYCNYFVQQLLVSGHTLDELNTFARRVGLSGSRSLTGFDFKVRTTHGEDKHMKAFGSEMIDIVAVLNIFADLVLAPRVLGRARRGLRLLYIIQEKLLGHWEVQDYDQLKLEVKQLREIILRVCPGMAKPKLHYLHHCVQAQASSRQVLNCFPCERKHKLAKGIGAYSYRSFNKTMLHRSTIYIFELFAKGQINLAPYYLDGTFKLEGGVRSSNIARTPRGPFHRGDVVRTTRGQFGVCVAFLASDDGFLCKMHLLLVSEAPYYTNTGEERLVLLEDIVETMYHISDAECVLIWNPPREI
jgi:hypothetical protein